MDFVKHPIWQVVEKLLYKHNCVIIPGFGGFVCNMEHARIDQVTHIIIPPGKHIVFNPNLKTNDGLLIANFASIQDISYTDALHSIDKWVEEFKSHLLEEKNIEIPHFGRFRVNAEANFVFIPDHSNRYDFRSFGLSPHQAQVVGSRQIKTKSSRIFKELKSAKPARSKSKLKFWQTTLAATLCLLLVVNSWIYFAQPDKQIISNSSLSLTSWFDSAIQDRTATPTEAPIKSSETVIEPVVNSIIEKPIIELDEKAALANPNNIMKSLSVARAAWTFPPQMEQPEPTPASEMPTAIENTLITLQSNYYVIAGVFCVEKNAVNYVNELKNKGIDAQVLHNPAFKCNRVSVGGFASKTDAEKYLRKAKQDINPDAWVLATQ